MSLWNPPPRPSNRPGLPAIAYRIGDYNTFRQRLLAVLSTPVTPGGATLAKLTTRELEDWAIAWLDACAVVADVLTFYQERIANEGYLLTATERRSVLELARAIGYELSPGVAASTYVTFSVDEAASTPDRVIVPQGTQINSVPGEGELPQTFETIEEIVARADWSAMRPRSTRPQTITSETRQLYLQGIDTKLQAGDRILLIDDRAEEATSTTIAGDRWFLLDLTTVEPDAQAGHTRITWEQQRSPINPLLSEQNVPLLFHNPKLFAFRQRAALFGNNAPRWETMPNEIKRAAAEKYIEEAKGTEPSIPTEILINGGVFSLTEDSDRTTWKQISKGLPNNDILCLAVNARGVVFAGTAGEGIFRFDAESQIWKAVNTGLTNLNVQTLFIDERGHLFAGTSAGGVFRSKDDGENWVPINAGSVRVESRGENNWQSINTGVPNTIIRSIALYTTTNSQGTGRISVDTRDVNRRTIRGIGTEFTKELSRDSEIIASGKTFTVTAVNSDVSLTVNTPVVILNLEQGTRFTTNSNDSNANQGTISSIGTIVTGRETNFRLLQVGNQITVTIADGFPNQEQTRTIEAIISETSLRINEPFQRTEELSPLEPNSSFEFSPPIKTDYIFIGTDSGIYRSQDEGKNWYQIGSNLANQAVYALELYPRETPHFLIAGTETGLYFSNDNGTHLQKINTNTEPLVVRALVINEDGHIWAGTSDGIRSYIKENDTWRADENKEELIGVNVQSLALNQSEHIFAGTPRGIQISQDNGENWTSIHEYLDKIDCISLLSTGGVLEVLAGSRFKGFDEESIAADNNSQPRDEAANTVDSDNQPSQESTRNQTGEWPGFRIREPQQIDLDTLYPQILAGSWMVLLDVGEDGIVAGNRKEALALGQIARTINVSRQDFLLDTKVTRLETTNPVPSAQQFNLRSTVVLAKSEELSLAAEQLIVPTQQYKIFLDPLHDKQIFLSQYVQGLKTDQRLIISGKSMRAKMAKVGGVFYSVYAGERWQHINDGLTNTDVRSLVSYISDRGLNLYAGTSDGVFQSNIDVLPLFLNWTSLNRGLTNKTIQALTISSDGNLFAGTPDGIFRLLYEQQTWQLINTGLTHLDVRTLVSLTTETSETSQQFLFAGTVKGGVFRSTNNGNTWTQTGLTNADVQTLAINPTNNSEMVAGTVASGIFRSTNQGNSWNQITEWQPSNSTIKSEATQVIISDPNDSQTLQRGDTIKAAGQVRTVVNINSSSQAETGSTQFIIDAPFQPDLLPGTPFSISTGLTNPNVTALLFNTAGHMFAGTAGSGVFYSTNNGKQWQQINTGLNDLEIRCLAVDEEGYVFVGTRMGGIFRSRYHNQTWNAFSQRLDNVDERAIALNDVMWEPRSQNVTNTDVQVILCSPVYDYMFAAGSGILIATDQSQAVPLHLGDILRVAKPPSGSLPEQQWTVVDQNGFEGTLVTSHPDDLLLLPAAEDDNPISEVCYVERPPIDQQQPVLTLKQPLQYSYDPTTVTISANVALATHGETVQEVLGSGNGAIANQTFTLQKPPLTYISANTATGAKSTLEVRVNNVLWQEVPSLYGLTAKDQNYMLRIEDDGSTNVIFGDGQEGARLPTGEENVTAQYRTGIGLEGEVNASSLTLLNTRPLGIVEVTNPLPATGAQAREQLEDARVKAPASVRNLDRIVSLRDFEDFAQAFAGIGKAQAVVLRDLRFAAALRYRSSQLVHITIAAIGGKVVDKNSNLYNKLVQAINANSDPMQGVQVDSYEPLLFNLAARILVDPRYQEELVIPAVHTALLETFAFEKRAFGQSVTDSEAIAAMQAIAGVVAVDLDALYRFGFSRASNSVLTATPAYWNQAENTIYPAQLLLINPIGIDLKPVLTL
jgi:ligand-binding sensor domain-containing protein